MAIEKNFIECLNELKRMLELTENEKENLKNILPQHFQINTEIKRNYAGNRLNDDEQNFILENYPKMKISQIAFKLNRCHCVIRSFLKRKNKIINRIRKEPLTPSEKEYILANYQILTVNDMANELKKALIKCDIFST